MRARAPLLIATVGLMLGLGPRAARAADLAPVGARCAGDAECASGRCLASPDDPQLRYCTAECSADGLCEPGPLGGGKAMTCASTEDPAVKLCVYPGPITPTGVGWPCQSGDECAGGICTATGDGSGECTRPCVAFGGGDCPLGFTCQGDPADATRHVCLAAPPGGGWCAASPAGRGGRVAWGLALLAMAAMLARTWARRSAS